MEDLNYLCEIDVYRKLVGSPGDRPNMTWYDTEFHINRYLVTLALRDRIKTLHGLTDRLVLEVEFVPDGHGCNAHIGPCDADARLRYVNMDGDSLTEWEDMNYGRIVNIEEHFHHIQIEFYGPCKTPRQLKIYGVCEYVQGEVYLNLDIAT